MKYNYTEEQYLQIAIEQFYRMMREVPFVSYVDIFPTEFQRDFGDFRAVIHYANGDRPQEFLVELKSRGEKRFVHGFMLMATRHMEYQYTEYRRTERLNYLFMAPYISSASAEELRKEGYGYMDLSGNCYILTDRILISVSGRPNQYVEHRMQKNYFSKSASAASAIMRTMLDEPDKLWQVKELSERTGKALGTVSNVKRFLLDHVWVEDVQGAFRLCNIREMLYTWAKDYAKKDARTIECYSFDAAPEIERNIMIWNERSGANATLGSFAAAVRYAPTVRYSKVHVYVEQQDVAEFIQGLDLQVVAKGGNVVITIPHDETPCMFSRKIMGALVTSPVQTVIDLLIGGGRGEEAADAIILREFR